MQMGIKDEQVAAPDLHSWPAIAKKEMYARMFGQYLRNAPKLYWKTPARQKRRGPEYRRNSAA